MSTWLATIHDEEPGEEASGGRDRPRSRSTPLAPRALNGHGDVVKLIDELPKAAVDAARELLSELLRREGGQGDPTALGFSSPLAGEGVTFVAQTVAAVLAHDFRQRVCLIDLNWPTAEASRSGGRRQRRRRRRRTDHDVEPLTGLADALRRELIRRDHQLDDEDPRREARRASMSLRELLFETNDPRLTYVAAGVATSAEAEVFARSEQLPQIIAALARHHDRLILDLPPVLASGGGVPLTRLADSMVLVVRHGVTTEAQVRAALNRLGTDRVAGIVLNQASSKIPRPLRRRLASW
jgi:Mrp family chromosome partitioning ATPase